MNNPEKLANIIFEEIKDANGEIKFPICPFKILKNKNVIIALRPFEDLLGVILNDEDNVTVVGIKYDMSYTRQRFTAAHELCHYIKDLKLKKGEVSSIECLNNKDIYIEKFADKFASFLLMPNFKLKEICDNYKNEDGYVDFKNITIIAEYFGVSFRACVNRIAYDLKMIDGDITPECLSVRINQYKPDNKRKKLLKSSNDEYLLSNMIDSLSYIMFEHSKFTEAKFLQDYIYYDNKLEGLNIEKSNVNYILADLNYNQEESVFFNSDEENICMTLGNLKLQKYVIDTNDKMKIYDCKLLHSFLYDYVPFPDSNGKFRNGDAIIRCGTIQPVSVVKIRDELDKLEEELKCFNKLEDVSISNYIKQVAYFVYKFVVIHPFPDGNGRVSRALMNWMLKERNIPPIYIDDLCKSDYYDALSKIDLENNYTPFVIFIQKRILCTLMQIHQFLFIDDLVEDKEESYVA